MKSKNSSKKTNFLYEHSSLLLIATGSLAFFIANIYAKKFFSTDDFNIWIYTVSLISFFSTFALMGQDQLLLRFSNNQNAKITIDRTSVRVIIASLIIFIPISLFLFQENVMGLTVTQLIVLPILFGLCKLGYQLARAKKFFILAQLSLNGWKLILISIISFSAVFGVVNLFILSFFAGVSILFSLLFSIKIEKIEKFENVSKYCFGYLLSMGVMAVFVYFERFLIEGKISIDDYANFLYFITISLSMFTILAAYFGFKEAVKYKEHFDLKTLNDDLLKVIFLIVPLSFIWGILIYFSAPVLNMVIDTRSLILVCFIGVLKCIYSVLSSVIAVRMEYRDIIKININTIIIFILFFFATVNFVLDINYLLMIVAVLWFMRSAMVFYNIKMNQKF